jgi:hypothetical protein
MHEQDGGFVYVQTNDADKNEVVVFERGPTAPWSASTRIPPAARARVRPTCRRRARSCSPASGCS